MPSLRSLLTSLVTSLAMLAALASIGSAQAQTKITVGKVVGGNGLHIPSYVADAAGIFKQEGLEARFISLTGKAQVTAGMSGNLDFVPIPSGGAQAALNGAEIRYVVGQSMSSQWVFVTRGDITKVEDLKGKTIGYGRLGSADYDEGATYLARFFNMQVGKDYKVIAYQGEPERIPALLNKDIDATMVSAAHAAQAVSMGMKVIARTSDKMPRVGGTFWSAKAFTEKNPETVKKFTRAIAKAVMYLRDNKDGSVKAIKEHLGIDNDKLAGLIWDELHNSFGAELPKDQFREIFESRRLDMIAENQWPKDKPLPDPEQFLLRAQLESTLKEVKYVPAKVGTN
jgi:ABC-type nitrate/sulfonate/bicarbonate transport system substrate-binding protein